MLISKNGQHACSSGVISTSAAYVAVSHGNSKSYPLGNSRTAASDDCSNAASSRCRTLCSLESAVISHANGMGLLIFEKPRRELLRLQPRLRHNLRAQLAEQAI